MKKCKLWYLYNIRLKYGISNSIWWRISYWFSFVVTYRYRQSSVHTVLNHGKSFGVYRNRI